MRGRGLSPAAVPRVGAYVGDMVAALPAVLADLSESIGYRTGQAAHRSTTVYKVGTPNALFALT